MKKILPVILSVLIICQSLLSVGIVLYYHINKTYISQQLCENRNKPQMHCNGHCYLSKQLKKSEEGEQKQSQNIVKEQDEVVPHQCTSVLQQYIPSYTVCPLPCATANLYTYSLCAAILKPPVA